MKLLRIVLCFLLAFGTAACSSDDQDDCDVTGGRPLAESAWPKFRRDSVNSGRSDVDLSDTNGACATDLLAGEGRFEAIVTSPIVGDNDLVYLVARSTQSDAQLRLYEVDQNGNDSGFPIGFPASVSTTIASTPLLSQNNRIVIPLENGLLQSYDLSTDLLLPGASIGPSLSGAPVIDIQGTIYQGNTSGSFFAICANGIPRFARLTSGSRSSLALFEGATDALEDDLTVMGGSDGRLRGFDVSGIQRWVFTTAGPISASPVIDIARQRAYVADGTGRVFAVRLSDGARCTDFSFAAGATISASPALGRDVAGAPGKLFVAVEDGFLYALDLTAQSPIETCTNSSPPAVAVSVWGFLASGPIRSSPAVAAGGANDVVVFGADDGCIYALPDDVPNGGDQPSPLWINCPAGAEGGIGTSSAALDSQGTVYIGSGEGGQLLKIEPRRDGPDPDCGSPLS